MIPSLFSVWERLLPTDTKKRMMVRWYNLIASLDRDGDVMFMNHGYQDTQPGQPPLELPPDLEPYRYPLQLYDRLAREVDWRGKDALEISCGLGGGTVWVWRNYAPRSLTGLDIAAQQIDRCQQRFGTLGIAYETGDAQAMRFADDSFDIILNIESSLNYRGLGKFLSEVRRVLRPGGLFLFADYRRSDRIPQLRQKLSEMGLETTLLADLTPGIVQGIEHEDLRKRNLIQRLAPRFLAKTVAHFAGVGHGARSEQLQFSSGRKTYVAAILRKPLAVVPAPGE